MTVMVQNNRTPKGKQEKPRSTPELALEPGGWVSEQSSTGLKISVSPSRTLYSQALLTEPLHAHSPFVQLSRELWEKTRVNGQLSFNEALLECLFPPEKVMPSGSALASLCFLNLPKSY